VEFVWHAILAIVQLSQEINVNFFYCSTMIQQNGTAKNRNVHGKRITVVTKGFVFLSEGNSFILQF